MKHILITLIVLAGGLASYAQDRTIVTAPESPYAFEPLHMFVFPAKDFPITKFGARRGDVKSTTEAFAKAMAACNKAGGGRVVVPGGEWLTGPIHFKSNCNLYLSEGARLVFEDDLSLYYPAVQVSWEGAECMNISPLLYAFGCRIPICRRHGSYMRCVPPRSRPQTVIWKGRVCKCAPT